MAGVAPLSARAARGTLVNYGSRARYTMLKAPMSGIQREARRLLESGVLGRSPQLVELFEYLVTASERNRSPKEAEIAHDVFGRDAAFEPAQDALVRVHVHRLRTKLERFYADHPAPDGERLAIPKGEYRLVLETPTAPIAVPGESGPARRGVPWRGVAIALLAACIALAGVLVAGIAGRQQAETEPSPMWDRYRHDSRTALIIAGDRVHDTAASLPAPVPGQARRPDVESTDLPVGVATALRHVIPALIAGNPGRQRLRLLPMSQVTPDMMRAANIVYVGQFGDIAMIGEPLFSAARIVPSADGRGLVDRATGKEIARAPDERSSDPQRQSDFGYIASFRGPSGNRITIIAGGGNAGLMQAAEVAAAEERISQVIAASGGKGDFEAVLTVTSLHDMNMGSRLAIAAPLDATAIWREGTIN